VEVEGLKTKRKDDSEFGYPLITIITVCLNSEKTIRQTIESVLSQNYINIEYIVLDGHSTDGTLEILKDYKKAHPDKFYFVSESDSGLYYAMNKGIDMANGNLIGIINSDDVYSNEAISDVVSAWLEYGCPDLVLGSTAIMNDACLVARGIAKPTIMKDKFYVQIPHPSSFVRKSAYLKYGKFDTNFRYAADRDLMLRLIHANATFKILDSVLAYFRQGGLGSRIGITAQIENFKIDKTYLGFITACYNFGFNFEQEFTVDA
jgi:glycosyltransferase involved in cell wall biosynthesis